jgi:hypothetical protein
MPARPQPAQPGQPQQDAALEHLRMTHQLLEQLLSRENLDLLQVAASNGPRRVRRMPDWPIPGGCRYVVGVSGYGGVIALVEATAQQILSTKESRLGGSITNTGDNPAFLYGCSLSTYNAGTVASPCHFLAPNGGTWNFLDGHILWCGDLVAYSALGTTVTLAEY